MKTKHQLLVIYRLLLFFWELRKEVEGIKEVEDRIPGLSNLVKKQILMLRYQKLKKNTLVHLIIEPINKSNISNVLKNSDLNKKH